MKESFPEPIKHEVHPTLDGNSSKGLILSSHEGKLKIQAVLALRLYNKMHPDTTVDEWHPEMIDRTVKNEAMGYWLTETNGESFSTRYHDYIEDTDHGSEVVSFSDVFVDSILNTITPKNETSH